MDKSGFLPHPARALYIFAYFPGGKRHWLWHDAACFPACFDTVFVHVAQWGVKNHGGYTFAFCANCTIEGSWNRVRETPGGSGEYFPLSCHQSKPPVNPLTIFINYFTLYTLLAYANW